MVQLKKKFLKEMDPVITAIDIQFTKICLRPVDVK